MGSIFLAILGSARTALVSIGLDDLLHGLDLLGNLGIGEDCGLGLLDLLLSLVEGLSLDLPLGFQSLDDVLVFPSNLVSESTQRAEPSAVFEPEHLQGGGDDHLLLLVIWGRDSLEGLKTLEGLVSTVGLVGDHAAHTSVEDLARGTEVEGSSGGENVAPLLQEVEVLQFVPVEVTRDVNRLSSDDHDLVAVQDELGDNAGQTAEHMAAAINYNCLRRKSRHFSLVEVNQAILAW